MKEMKKLLMLLVVMAASLAIVTPSLTSYAAEETGESSGCPEPIVIEIPEVVGGRSERLAYLGCMRYYFGADRPLSEYAEWLISEGWDPNGWLWELLGELYPDETPILPDAEGEEPIAGGRSERLAYLGSMRYYFGLDRPLYEYAEWLISEGWDPNGWMWELLEELYPDESYLPPDIEGDPSPDVYAEDEVSESEEDIEAESTTAETKTEASTETTGDVATEDETPASVETEDDFTAETETKVEDTTTEDDPTIETVVEEITVIEVANDAKDVITNLEDMVMLNAVGMIDAGSRYNTSVSIIEVPANTADHVKLHAEAAMAINTAIFRSSADCARLKEVLPATVE